MFDEGKLKVVATTAFLFAFLSAGGAVNAYSYQVTIYLRTAFVCLSVIAAFLILLQKQTVSRKATYIFAVIFAAIAIYFPHEDLSPRFIQTIGFSIGAIILAYIASAASFARSPKIYNMIIGATIAYIGLLFITSGINFDGFVPIIAYSLWSDQGTIAFYSQGVSKIFSVAIVAVTFKIAHDQISLKYKLFLSILILGFLILSLAGGSRGEVLVCLIVVVIVFSRNWIYILVGCCSISLVILAVYLFGDFETFMKLPTVWRLLFTIETSSLGQRDVLLRDSLLLLSQNPRCAFFGCGLRFFQDYYGYDFGTYPHNWVAEFVISFGVILFVILFVFVWIFVARNYAEFASNEKFLMMLSLYFFGISLKSGNLIGDPLLYGSFFPVLFLNRNTGQSSSASRGDSVRRAACPPT